MALELLDHCPIRSDCGAKALFKDTETLEVVSLDRHTNRVKVHICRGQATRPSQKPDTFYMSKWNNNVTGRDRYQGPSRSISTVMNPPPDSRYVKRGGNPSWDLIEVSVCRDPKWEVMDPGEAKRLYDATYASSWKRPAKKK